MRTRKKLIDQFNRIADMLLPFAAGVSPDNRTWSGETWSLNEYDPGFGARMPDPAAREWYAMFRVAATLLETQRSSLSEKQLLYLQRTFAGGMGSFQDFRLDEEEFGANKQLEIERHALLELLTNYHPQSARAS